MFKKNVLMGMLALAFVTLAAGEVRAWELDPNDPLYGCLVLGFCSYQGDVTIKGAKGSSVSANAVFVTMQQTAPANHAVAFCANPSGFIQRGQSFNANVTAVAPVGSNICDTNGKCPVSVDQATKVTDLPAVCTNSNCPAVCTPGQTAEQCLAVMYNLQLEGKKAVCNNNFSLVGVAWDVVVLKFVVIDQTSASNPVATLDATCTSPDGLQLHQPHPWICQVQ